MERDGDYSGPPTQSERWLGLCNEEFRQEWFKPDGPGVLIVMDYVKNEPLGSHRRTRKTELKVEFTAVRADKRNRDSAFERQTASLAERRLDPPDRSRRLGTAPADITFGRFCRFAPADLTEIRVEKPEQRLKPGPDESSGRRRTQLNNPLSFQPA